MDTKELVSLYLYDLTCILTKKQFHLAFKQPECHFIAKQRCQGRNEYVLFKMQSVKDDCQETAQPDASKLPLSAATKCLQERTFAQACGSQTLACITITWRACGSTECWAHPQSSSPSRSAVWPRNLYF